MIAELESRAAAPSTSLTSSFLPRCAHLLRFAVAQCPTPKKPCHCIAASTKQKKKARKSSPARGWSYEHFMVLWDEVFGHCCTDPVKATQIRNLACEGLEKHGRGCVLVYQEVQTRPRGAGTGFTSKPPKSSRNVPDFVTLDYYAAYLPREFLLDPRKAPLGEDATASDEKERPKENAAHVKVEKQGHESYDINNEARRQQNDRSGDRVVDIGEIIREAQNVYSFYSDDEDDSDGDASDGDESLLHLDDKEGDSKPTDHQYVMDNDVNKVDTDRNVNDSLLILDDGYTNATDSLIILDDDISGIGDSSLKSSEENTEVAFHDINITNCADASESLDDGVSALMSCEDKADPYASKPLLQETQDKENITAKPESIFVHEYVEPEHNSNTSLYRTQENRGDGHNVEELKDCAVNLSEEDDRSSEVQAGSYGSKHVKANGLCSGGTVPSLIDSSDESVKGEAVELRDLVVYVQGNQSQQDESSDNDEIPLATQPMLYACMRGVDRTRLMSLTANFDFEAERFRFARKMAVIDVKTADAGGEDPYNPSEEELVLLLHLCFDGKPAFGADVVVAYRDELQTNGFGKDLWKLRGKYKHIVA